MLYGQEHVKAYEETGGEAGHEWRPGVFTLLLRTRGGKTGRTYVSPLIYRKDGDDYVVVASKGGAPEHPNWYKHIQADPDVEIQVEDEVMPAVARTVTGEERARLWDHMAEVWPDYNVYAEKTDREIPVVVLAPRS